MNKRETILVAVVGTAAFAIVNYSLFSFFKKNHERLTKDIVAKETILKKQRADLADKDLWKQRQAWLSSTQPRLDNENSAGVDMMNFVKATAQKAGIVLEQPAINPLQKRENRTSVSVNCQIKCDWRQLVAFLDELQGPDKFIVLETANVQIDKADKAKVHATFQIAKWFAPQS